MRVKIRRQSIKKKCGVKLVWKKGKSAGQRGAMISRRD